MLGRSEYARVIDFGKIPCRWPGCDAKIPREKWSCDKHWHMIPLRFQHRLFANYHPNQDETRSVSREYLAIVREFEEWVATNSSS